MSAPIYRADIDGLRAVAVSMVLIFHAFPKALPGGFIGVDVFFVISGFLIGGILLDQSKAGNFRYVDFYSRRIKRLFPALSTVMIVTIVLGFVFLNPSDYEKLGNHIISGVSFISNIQLMKESGYFDVDSAQKPLLHLWSLGVEEQFYIFFPILIPLLLKGMRFFISVVIFFFLLSFSLNLLWMIDAPHKSFYHPAARFWELLVGVLVAVWVRSNMVLSGRYSNLASFVGASFILIGLLMIKEGQRFPGWWALLPVIGAALLVGPGRTSFINRNFLSNKALVGIGLISYSLYLWHWPLLSLTRINFSNELSFAVAAGVLGVSVSLAWATWRFIENPIRYSKRRIVKILIFIMIGLGLTGLLIKESHGFSQRYPKEIQAIISQNYDGKLATRAGSCFMKTEQKHSDFSSECFSIDQSGSGKKVLLWGDFHAAHLYPGLAEIVKRKPFNLLQLTASGCPPVFNVNIPNRPACRGINNFVYSKILEAKPDIIVMGGFWHQYNGSNGWGLVGISDIKNTINLLKLSGVNRIIIIGQVPIWKRNQPSIIVSIWDNEKLMVDYTNQDLDLFSLATDHYLYDQFRYMPIDFISPSKIFCKSNSCLTFTNKDRLESVAFDYGHLTISASIMVANEIYKKMEF